MKILNRYFAYVVKEDVFLFFAGMTGSPWTHP